MDYLNHINDRFPIRRNAEQKRAFQEFARKEAAASGYPAEIECLQGKHHNIVIGDPASAKVVFTAHYDTPASALVPNLMLPRNPAISFLYHFAYPIVLALVSVGVARLVQVLFSMEDTFLIVAYLLLYFVLFYLCNWAFPNKHNKNDNTSGVAVLLSVMSRMQSEDAAFILFDNEEKGLLGSKAYVKAHKDFMEEKLLINLDCVGVGENFLVIAKEDAQKMAAFRLLQECLHDKNTYRALYYPAKGSSSNSDHKNFKCGVGIMACKKSKILGYYTTHIHTARDTVASIENIDYISESLLCFLQKLEA